MSNEAKHTAVIDAYNEGDNAQCVIGDPALRESSNPYAKGDPNRELWFEGWDDAVFEAKDYCEPNDDEETV